MQENIHGSFTGQNTALLISDRSLIEPRWGGRINLASNASKKRHIIIKGSMLLWSAFDWGHHTDIKQFSEKQANKCIPKSHCSPHIYSVKQSVHYQSISSSLFCSVKWAMSSLHPSHCSLWGHSRNTRTLTNPRLSETVSSRPKEIERERASETKVSWFQMTHCTFLIHCKGYFPIKSMNYVFKMLIRRKCKQSQLCKTKSDVI